MLWTLYNDNDEFEKYNSEDCYNGIRSYDQIVMRFWIWDIVLLANPGKEKLFVKIYNFKEIYSAESA